MRSASGVPNLLSASLLALARLDLGSIVLRRRRPAHRPRLRRERPPIDCSRIRLTCDGGRGAPRPRCRPRDAIARAIRDVGSRAPISSRLRSRRADQSLRVYFGGRQPPPNVALRASAQSSVRHPRRMRSWTSSWRASRAHRSLHALACPRLRDPGRAYDASRPLLLRYPLAPVGTI